MVDLEKRKKKEKEKEERRKSIKRGKNSINGSTGKQEIKKRKGDKKKQELKKTRKIEKCCVVTNN